MTQKFAILYPNLVTESTAITGGSWLAGAPVTNVGTRPLAETARSTSASNTAHTKILIDHGSAKTARALKISAHNLSSSATIVWKRGTSSGGSEVSNSGSVAAWRFSPETFDGTIYDADILLSAENSARYDTIEITDTSNAAGFVDIGRVLIGPVFESRWNPSYGLRHGHIEKSTVGEAKGGADWAWEGRRIRTVQFVLDFLTLAEGDLMDQFAQTHGITREVGWLPYNDVPARMQQFGMLALMRELSGIAHPRYSENSMAFSLRKRV